MKAPTLRALPPFLRYLRTYPPPDALLTALLRGPLAGYEPGPATLWRLEDAELVSVAWHGMTIEEAERYARIPLLLDFDISTAVKARRSSSGPARGRGDSRVSIVDDDFWNSLVDRARVVSVVRVPLVLNDDAVGALSFTTRTEWPDDAESRDLIDILAAVLALWLTHPLAHIPAADPLSSHGQWSLTLTPRQAEIMRRVGDGQRQYLIASELGLSDATVKKEVQHVMRTMGTSDRRIAAERARHLGLI